MNDSIQIIPLANLAIVFIPVVAVLLIYVKWAMDVKEASYSIGRMLLQLTFIGYILGFIFNTESAWVLFGVLSVMLFASSWIALRTVKKARLQLLGLSLLSIIIGSISILILIMLGVLDLNPWYEPRYIIPLGGMLLASAMNCISLAIDRLFSELKRNVPYSEARNIAFQAALIPVVNSLFAVGLVTLPGMMTGQILSGVDPLIAARYQIMVMCMIFGSTGLTTACFLLLCERKIKKIHNQ